MKNSKKVDWISVWFSTVSIGIYYIASPIIIAVLIEITTILSSKYNIMILYWLAIAVYIVTMTIIYLISKKHKEKHNELNVKQLTLGRKAMRICIKTIITLVVLAIAAFVNVWITIGCVK